MVLARVDELVPAVRTSPLAEHKELQQLIKKAAKALTIPENRIYFSVPYFEERQRSTDIELNTLKLLEKAIVTGLETAQRFADVLTRDEDDDVAPEISPEAKRLSDLYLKKMGGGSKPRPPSKTTSPKPAPMKPVPEPKSSVLPSEKSDGVATPGPAEGVKTWDVDAVEAWLQIVGLGKHAALFREHDIDVRMLILLSDVRRVCSLGQHVVAVGARRPPGTGHQFCFGANQNYGKSECSQVAICTLPVHNANCCSLQSCLCVL